MKSSFRLTLAVIVAFTITGCPESLVPRTSPGAPLTSRVVQPRVALLDGDTAAIAYEQVVQGGNSPAAVRSLHTRLYSMSMAASSAQSSFDAFTGRFGSNPIGMSEGRDGYAITMTGGEVSGDGVSIRRPLGCVHTAAGPASCTALQLEAARITAAVHADADRSIALFGAATAMGQRLYDKVAGWGAIAPGPVVPADFAANGGNNLLRWRDGTMFLSGTTLSGTTLATAHAVRYDPVSASWQPAERLGESNSPAVIALHADAPTLAPLAVWPHSSGGGIEYSLWQAGSGWSTTAAVPGSSADATAPGARMWPNGDVLVVWADGPVTNRNVVAATRIAGVWGSVVIVGATNGMPRRIAVGADRHGNAVAVWANVGALMSASYVVNEGWQGAASIGFLADPTGSEDLDVAMEPGGRALAVWAEPEAGGQPGSRLAMAAVGPSVLSLSAQRYTFGGEAVPVTIRLAVPPAQATTVSISTTLPAASATLPASTLPIAANQNELTFDIQSSSVNDFVDGRIDVVYAASSASQPITLMPEPTDLSVQVSPASVRGGETATITVTTTPVYPQGLVIAMTSSDNIAPVPAQLTTSLPSSAATATITTLPTFAVRTAVFSASLRGLPARSASLLINPTALGQTALTVSKLGLGSVTSNPAGIDCGAVCSVAYPMGTPVTLLPAGQPGHRFFGWGGDADCSDGGLTMSAARNCTVFFQPQLPPYSDGVSWTYLGNLLFDGLVNPTPALALDGLHPVVAWINLSASLPDFSTPQLYVSRHEFGSYVGIGDQSSYTLNVDSQQTASEPAIATTFPGMPYVAWIEGSGAQQNLYVKRWTGDIRSVGDNRWESVGTANAPLNFVAGSRASSPSIVIDDELRPWVAWVENGSVKFKRFDGTAWVAAPGGDGPASANADRVRLAEAYHFDVATNSQVQIPVIAWTQGSGMARALKVVHNFGFDALGVQVNPPSLNALTEFGLSGEAGGALITWGDGDTPYTVRAQRWNGADWVDVRLNDVASSTIAGDRLASVAMTRTGLTVAYAETSPANGSAIYVNTRLGSDWIPLTVPFSFPGETFISLTAVEEPTGGSPIVVIVRRNASNLYVWQVLRYYP